MSDISITRKGFRCLRCGYEWIPRYGRPPKLCPKCRSSLWNKPRVRQMRKKGQPSMKKIAREVDRRRQIIRKEFRDSLKEERAK